VFVRTASEMEQIARLNPFSGEPGSKVAAIFLESSRARRRGNKGDR